VTDPTGILPKLLQYPCRISKCPVNEKLQKNPKTQRADRGMSEKLESGNLFQA